MKHKPVNVVKLLIIILVAIILLADLYCEIFGLPGMVQQAVQEKLEDSGMAIDARNIRGGLITGLNMEGLTIWDAERGSAKMLVARKVSVQPRILPLFTGKLVPRKLKITNAKIFLPVHGDGQARKPPLIFNQVNAGASFRRGYISISYLDMQVLGASISANGNIRNWRQATERLSSATVSRKTLSWDLILSGLPERYYNDITAVRTFADQQMLSSKESFLTTSFDLDLAAPVHSTCKGRGQIADATIAAIPVHKIKGQFSLRRGQFNLSNFKVLAGFKTSLAGNLSFDISSSLIAGRITGYAEPQMVYRALDRPMPRWLAECRLPVPPWFRVQIHPSPLPPHQWQLSGQFRLQNIIYRSTLLRAGQGQISRSPRRLALNNLDLNFNAEDRERLTGHLEVENRTVPQLSGEINGRVDPGTVLDIFPPLPRKTAKLEKDLAFNEKLPQISLRFKHSGLTPDTWNCKINFEAENFAFRDLPVSKLQIPLSIGPDQISTDTEIICTAGAQNRQRLSAQVDIDIQKKEFTASGKAKVYAKRLSESLQTFTKSPIKKFTSHGVPAELTFRLQECPLLKPSDWKADFSLRADDVSFDTLKFNHVEGRGSITPERLTIASATGASADFQDVELTDFSLNLNRFEVSFKGYCQADPLVVQAFIPKGRSRENYRKIWSDFDWGKTKPKAEFERIHFKEFPSGRWILEIQAAIQDDKVTYRGLKADYAEVYLNMRLPQRIILDKLKATAGDQNVSGKIKLELTGDPLLTFEGKGRFDPFRAFSVIGPKMKERLAKLDVDDATNTSVKGVIHLRGDPRPRVEGRLKGDWLEYHPIRFENFTADWKIVEHELKWNIPEATLSGGAASVRGFYNGFFGTGHLALDIKNANLAGIINRLQEKEMEKEVGTISCSAVLDTQNRGQGSPLSLNGTGEVHIRNGELWDTPILKNLGDTLGIASLGRISELDADIDFNGHKAVVPEFSTDGTLLALSGNGIYNWAANSLNFKVYGQALKSTSFVPLVLKPLSWFFEAELKGKPENFKWQLLGPIRRMLPGRKNKN